MSERVKLSRWFKRFALAGLIGVTGLTCRVVRVNWNVLERLRRDGQAFVIGYWHNNIVSSIYYLAPLGDPVLISRSRDGEDIAWVAERFGYRGVRGSDAAGAAAAMRQALRFLAAGQPVTVTPDGPRGPRYVLKPGIVALARKAKVPIVPVTFSCARRWEFGSWDRMKLPKPFSTVALIVGDPIEIGDMEVDAARERVEAAMRAQVRISETFTGANRVFRDAALGGAEDEKVAANGPQGASGEPAN